MVLDDFFGYSHLDGVQIVQLPYTGGLSMVVFLPDDTDGYGSLEARIGENYSRWTADLSLHTVHRRRVQVELPRWTTASTWELIRPLLAMGAPLAGDFGAVGPPNIVPEWAIQRAIIEVNEKGTVAAAATVVGARVVSEEIGTEPKRFVADHPFLYAVRDDATGVILFLGRLVDPAPPVVVQ
jgi:serpin B